MDIVKGDGRHHIGSASNEVCLSPTHFLSDGADSPAHLSADQTSNDNNLLCADAARIGAAQVNEAIDVEAGVIDADGMEDERPKTPKRLVANEERLGSLAKTR